jgi:hypothetical protein
MDLKAINICMHELVEIVKICHQLFLDLAIRLDERGNIQMHSVSDPIDGATINFGVIFIFIDVRIFVSYFCLAGWRFSGTDGEEFICFQRGLRFLRGKHGHLRGLLRGNHLGGIIIGGDFRLEGRSW